MSFTFGNRPGDVVADSRGNTLSGVTNTFYATKADALARTSPLGSATATAGEWSFTADVPTLWVRTPAGKVYAITSAEATTADFTDQVNAAKDSAASAAADAAAAQAAAENAASLVGAPADAAMAAAVTNPATATANALNSTIGTAVQGEADRADAALAPVASGQAWDAKALTARLSRDGAMKAAQADGLAVFQQSSGLAVVGGYYAATVGGTDGTGIIPRYAKVSGVSFRVKITKSTVGSKSYVGWVDSAPGVMPSGSTVPHAFGYKQGVGIVFTREAGGADGVFVADSALTDGDEYDFRLTLDTALMPTADTKFKVLLRFQKSDGSGVVSGGSDVNTVFYPTQGNLLVRTNVAAGGITNLNYSAPASGGVHPIAGGGNTRYSSVAGEDIWIRAPKQSNGLAVLACHGHGGNYIETGWNSTSITPTWAALEAAGYTVFVPDLGGDLWGNDTVQDLLEQLHGIIVNDYKLDPRVFMWGNSMGGAATLNAISQRRFPIRAARLVDPICDLSKLWDNASYASMKTAYNNDPALRDQYNPVLLPTSSFAGVPLLFNSSSGDTVAVTADQAGAMRTKLGSTVETQLIATTGAHNAADAFRAQQTLAWFASHV